MHNAGLVLPVVAGSSMASCRLFSRLSIEKSCCAECATNFGAAVWKKSLLFVCFLFVLFISFTEHCLPSPGTTLSAVFEKETEINSK